MQQTGGAHPLLSGLSAQSQVQPRGQRKVGFLDIKAIALHIDQTERQRRLVHITEHVAEKRFVIGLADAQACLGHIIAVWHRCRQVLSFAQQPGLHFMLYHGHRHVIEDHVMEQQHRADALIQRVFGIGQAHQRCLSDIKAVVTRVEAVVQLRADITGCRVELQHLKRQLCVAPDHLHG
ncbi:hypothetical protein PssB301D_02661 [Pseudomonas syringae pv. syringae str. B301D-R]|nr:hypothetical protein PssB301D_02661 [Pseudomonas syringae pv. syringae str. B301D-R]